MIRVFAPHNGQLHFIIHNAHTKAISTIAVMNNGGKLISGGCDGQVIMGIMVIILSVRLILIMINVCVLNFDNLYRIFFI